MSLVDFLQEQDQLLDQGPPSTSSQEDDTRTGAIMAKNWFFLQQGPVPPGVTVSIRPPRNVMEGGLWSMPSFVPQGREKMLIRPQHVEHLSLHTLLSSHGRPPPRQVALDPLTQVRLVHYKVRSLNDTETPRWTTPSQITEDDLIWDPRLATHFGPLIRQFLQQQGHHVPSSTQLESLILQQQENKK